MLKRFLVLIKYFLFVIKRKLNKKRYLTPGQFKKIYKHKSKNDIIKEMIRISAKLNKGKAVIPQGYKKELRGYSKNQLINVIIELKLQHQFGD